MSLSSSQRSLIAYRQGIYRSETAKHDFQVPTLRLFSHAPIDPRVQVTLWRHIYDARVVLYNDGSLLLSNQVWDWLRACLRVPPRVFHDRQTAAWANLYRGNTPAAKSQWQRTVFSGSDVVPQAAPVASVPAAYANVPLQDVLRWLGLTGGRIIPLEEIPTGNRLVLGDIEIEVEAGQIAAGNLSAALGVPPYTYAEISDEANFITVASNGLVTARPPSGTTLGEHKFEVKATDSGGTVAMATVTVKIVAP